ncbi:MAG: hypothetical protein IT174_11695 [Acidobacteria bacterium]|nr:hypothetical protein [Acidobacteriota bacterium]
MTNYSDTYSPPAPTINIKIRNPVTLESIAVPMLLDTGSDLTLVPRFFCDKIGVKASETEFLELESFDRETSIAYYIRLDLTFLNKQFRGNFLVYDHSEGIIGRDILNEFSLVFDGPRLTWKEQE